MSIIILIYLESYLSLGADFIQRILIIFRIIIKNQEVIIWLRHRSSEFEFSIATLQV